MSTATMDRPTITIGEIDQDRIARDDCDHEWVQWSGANRCRKCGATQ
ncbi:hypothetical protein QMK19_03465 [Streptomyces sp. H10-C2]|nr:MULTISPECIES: hypothetical protein [unclassified Streptomyces]MDJ0342245.1 hypothetical protein [Streptomyces sp. PH10-H1]MDJ0368759.1 hypothetical protein [Streptomyces sp. H10-C2]